MSTVGAIALGLLIAVSAAMIVAEANYVLLRVAKWIVRRTASRLPRDAERWREEWVGDIESRRSRPLAALWQATNIARDGGRMRAQLLARPELTVAAQRTKRTLDVVIAGACLFALLPLLFALAVAIKVSSRGPVFYRQTRRGKGGRPITLLKLRTIDWEHMEPTAIGRYLRRTAVDELPQLINVLRGDMSLVGPRPLPSDAVSYLDAQWPDRPDLVPGLVGSAQLASGHSITLDDLVLHDLEYAEGWSLWRDIRLLGASVHAVLPLDNQPPPEAS